MKVSVDIVEIIPIVRQYSVHLLGRDRGDRWYRAQWMSGANGISWTPIFNTQVETPND